MQPIDDRNQDDRRDWERYRTRPNSFDEIGDVKSSGVAHLAAICCLVQPEAEAERHSRILRFVDTVCCCWCTARRVYLVRLVAGRPVADPLHEWYQACTMSCAKTMVPSSTTGAASLRCFEGVVQVGWWRSVSRHVTDRYAPLPCASLPTPKWAILPRHRTAYSPSADQPSFMLCTLYDRITLEQPEDDGEFVELNRVTILVLLSPTDCTTRPC